MASRELPFPDFYMRIVEGYHGSNVHNEPGNRPRGTFTRSKPGEVKIMAVLLNPGQPNACELHLESGLKGQELARELWFYSGNVWDGQPYSKTLSVLRRDASLLLGLPENECSRKFMFTNLVRCTTTGNRPPDREAVQIGINWLREEIALWRPQFIIAYHNNVAKALADSNIRYDAQLPAPAALGEWLIPGRREARVAKVRQELGL